MQVRESCAQKAAAAQAVTSPALCAHTQKLFKTNMISKQRQKQEYFSGTRAEPSGTGTLPHPFPLPWPEKLGTLLRAVSSQALSSAPLLCRVLC